LSDQHNKKAERIRIAVLALAILAALTWLWHDRRAREERVNKALVIDEAPPSDQLLSKRMISTVNIPQASLELGLKLARDKDYDGAKRVFETLLAHFPTSVSLLNNLAFIAGEQGQLDRAYDYLSTAIQVTGKCAECFNNLGSVLIKQGKAEEARQMFLRAVTLSPHYIDPKLNLAVLSEEKNDWDQALDWYQKAEPDITDPQVQKWVSQRRHWMAAISGAPDRQVANTQ